MYMNCFSTACHPCKCSIIHRQILQTDTAMIFVGVCSSGWWWIRATSFSLSNGRIGCSGCCFLCIGSRFTGLHELRRSCIWIHSGGKALGKALIVRSVSRVPLVLVGGICRVQRTEHDINRKQQKVDMSALMYIFTILIYIFIKLSVHALSITSLFFCGLFFLC